MATEDCDDQLPGALVSIGGEIVPPVNIPGVGLVQELLCDDGDPDAPPEPGDPDHPECKCATKRLCPLENADGENLTWWEICLHNGICKWRPRLDRLFQALKPDEAETVCDWIETNCKIYKACSRCAQNNGGNRPPFTGNEAVGDTRAIGVYDFTIDPLDGEQCPQDVSLTIYQLVRNMMVSPDSGINLNLDYQIDTEPWVTMGGNFYLDGPSTDVSDKTLVGLGCIRNVDPGTHTIRFRIRLVQLDNTTAADEVLILQSRQQARWSETCEC